MAKTSMIKVVKAIEELAKEMGAGNIVNLTGQVSLRAGVVVGSAFVRKTLDELVFTVGEFTFETALGEFIEYHRTEAVEACDEQMREYVSPEDIEECGDVYEAYCETCNNEAEDDICRDYACRFIDANPAPGTDIVNRFGDVQIALGEAWFQM